MEAKKTLVMNHSDNLQIAYHALIVAQNAYVIHTNTKHKSSSTVECEECTHLYLKYKQNKDYYLSAINIYLSPKGPSDGS